jgi:hypothetical protein
MSPLGVDHLSCPSHKSTLKRGLRTDRLTAVLIIIILFLDSNASI